MKNDLPFAPRAWTAVEVSDETSWVQRLSDEEIEGFRAALAYAQTAAKPLLAMTQADFPLSEAAHGALRRAIDTTQGRWGMCLVKGFPVDDWNEAQTKLAYWE